MKTFVYKKARPQVVPTAQVMPCLKFWAALILLQGLFLILPCEARCQEINLNIIAQIESSNNPLVYNKASKARGLYQITPIVLKEYCQFNDIWFADPDYLFNPAFNTQVAVWYLTKRIPQLLRHFNKPLTLENILIAYNAGIRAVVKGYCPKETKNYIAKYKRLAKGGKKWNLENLQRYQD